MYLRSLDEEHSVAPMTSCQHDEENVRFFSCIIMYSFRERGRQREIT